MPNFSAASVDPEPEENLPTAADQRRIQREVRSTGTGIGGPWKRASVGIISYEPPNEVRTTTEKIPAGKLDVDPRYNRDINLQWVEEIANAFNPDQLQVLNVSRRLFRVVQRSEGPPKEEQVFDGNVEAANRVEIVVISGQHRLLATLKARGELFLLTCNVYDGLTIEQEAELFALFDEKIRIHQPYQRHRAHYFGKNPEAVAIETITNGVGMKVYKGKEQGGQEGVIYAVSTLYSIARNNSFDFLERVLNIHYGSWQENKEGYTAPMLQGTAFMLRKYGQYAMWHDEWLISALSDPAHNPMSLRQRAQGAAVGISATSIAQEVARLEHRYYNQGKKGYSRLPEWNATAREILAQSDAARASRGRRTQATNGEKE
jgi:hypothetical protein